MTRRFLVQFFVPGLIVLLSGFNSFAATARLASDSLAVEIDDETGGWALTDQRSGVRWPSEGMARAGDAPWLRDGLTHAESDEASCRSGGIGDVTAHRDTVPLRCVKKGLFQTGCAWIREVRRSRVSQKKVGKSLSHLRFSLCSSGTSVASFRSFLPGRYFFCRAGLLFDYQSRM